MKHVSRARDEFPRNIKQFTMRRIRWMPTFISESFRTSGSAPRSRGRTGGGSLPTNVEPSQWPAFGIRSPYVAMGFAASARTTSSTALLIKKNAPNPRLPSSVCLSVCPSLVRYNSTHAAGDDATPATSRGGAGHWRGGSAGVRSVFETRSSGFGPGKTATPIVACGRGHRACSITETHRFRNSFN